MSIFNYIMQTQTETKVKKKKKKEKKIEKWSERVALNYEMRFDGGQEASAV